MIMGAWGLGRKRLPYDAEVEFLESTGTQWIDTGLRANENTSAQIRVAWMSIGPDRVAFGADNGSTFNGGFQLQVASTVFRFVRGTKFKDVRVPPNNSYPVAGTFYNISVGPSGIDVNGVLQSIDSTNSFTTAGTLPVFAWRRNAKILGGGTVKISYMKIYDGATLLHDYQAVRFTNEQGVSEGAMYDRANPTVGMNPDGSPRTDGLYRNRGTGAFLWAEKQ